MKTLVSIVGARPQFIKAAPVSAALRKHKGIREISVHTGQHFDSEMSDVFFADLGMRPPDFHLGIHGGAHADMTGRMMIALGTLFEELVPDAAMVYGDTNSTLAAALVAAKLYIPIAHVEAGLRSFRPMPEEINRALVDSVSRWLFCPTPRAVENLAIEGVRQGVHLVGDVMYDTTLAMIERARARSTVLVRLGLKAGEFDLATVHRAENTESRQALATVISYLNEQAADVPVVLPLHPRTREAAKRYGIDLSKLRVINPVGYLDMMALLDGCRRTLTDSGGLQKESYFHRKPCITLRDTTEWIETVEAGWNRLWSNPNYAERRQIDVYGDGRASEQIADILAREA